MAVLKPYRYSYSGADAKVFAMLADYPETIAPLESIHTLSVSVHEAKGQARSLGYRGIKGLSRGVRTIAGSIILTIVEDHPLRHLMIEAKNRMDWYRGGWSIDRDAIGVGTALNNFDFANRLAELLPPIDLLVTYVSEGSDFAASATYSGNNLLVDLSSYKGAAMAIQGIDFVDSGVVTSVNDIVSEVTLSFIATDFKPISLNEFFVGGGTIGNRTAQDLRRNHSDLMKVLYSDWSPPNNDSDMMNPDKTEEMLTPSLGDHPSLRSGNIT